MYDSIASNPMYEDALIDTVRQQEKVTGSLSGPANKKTTELTDVVRGTREANERRKQIAAALWDDYLATLHRQGMSVEEGNDEIHVNADCNNI